MTPRGHLNRATRVLKRHAKAGDVDGFRAYTRSDAFAEAIIGVGAVLRHALLSQYVAYRALCESNTAHPLVEPQRRPSSRWLSAEAQMLLARAYAKAGEDHEKAGRLLGCTAGAARLARKRYLDRANAAVSAIETAVRLAVQP